MGKTTRVTKGSSFYIRMIRNDPCALCGWVSDRPMTIDHIRPRSEGGTNAWFNFAGTCHSCNNGKRSNSLLGFLLGERIPNGFQVAPVTLPDHWYDPLGIIRATQ